MEIPRNTIPDDSLDESGDATLFSECQTEQAVSYQ